MEKRLKSCLWAVAEANQKRSLITFEPDLCNFRPYCLFLEGKMTEKNQIYSTSLTLGNTLNKKEAEAGPNDDLLAALSKETRGVSKNSLTTNIDLEKSE
jgi:hypothetical protein